MASDIGLPKGMSKDDAYMQGVADGERPRKAFVVQPINRPTFYLLADVQGIQNVEQAERIARDILKDAMIKMTVAETTLP